MKRMLVVLAALLSLNSAAFAEEPACIDLREHSVRVSGRAALMEPDYYEAGFMAFFSEGRIASTSLIEDGEGNTFPVQLENVGARVADAVSLDSLDLATGDFSLVLSLPDAAIESLSAELAQAGLPMNVLCADQAHFALKLPTAEDPDSYIMIRLYHGHGAESRTAGSISDERPLYSFEVGINLAQEE